MEEVSTWLNEWDPRVGQEMWSEPATLEGLTVPSELVGLWNMVENRVRDHQ